MCINVQYDARGFVIVIQVVAPELTISSLGPLRSVDKYNNSTFVGYTLTVFEGSCKVAVISDTISNFVHSFVMHLIASHVQQPVHIITAALMYQPPKTEQQSQGEECSESDRR